MRIMRYDTSYNNMINEPYFLDTSYNNISGTGSTGSTGINYINYPYINNPYYDISRNITPNTGNTTLSGNTYQKIEPVGTSIEKFSLYESIYN